MKRAFLSLNAILLIGTLTVYAERVSTESSSGFSLKQLETSTQNVFELLDADENGSITLEEIDLLSEDSEKPPTVEALASRIRLLQQISHYFWTDEEINRFEVGDTNRDRSMSEEEFVNLQTNIRTHKLELGLASMDSDNNGSVEANEFAAHLKSFRDWDTDGNGLLDRGEIAEITDRIVQIELHRDKFDMRREAEQRMYLAHRERVAAGQSRSRLAHTYEGYTANINDMREASKNTFKELDANDNGSITLDEIDIADRLIEGEEKYPPEKLAELRRRANIISYTFMNVEERVDRYDVGDTNQDGVLNEAEFDQLNSTVRTHILQFGLNSFDKDKNGRVELSEFSAHLDNIETVDSDGDGNISRKELLQADAGFKLSLDVQLNQLKAIDQAREAEKPNSIREEIPKQANSVRY